MHLGTFRVTDVLPVQTVDGVQRRYMNLARGAARARASWSGSGECPFVIDGKYSLWIDEGFEVHMVSADRGERARVYEIAWIGWDA